MIGTAQKEEGGGDRKVSSLEERTEEKIPLLLLDHQRTEEEGLPSIASERKADRNGLEREMELYS